ALGSIAAGKATRSTGNKKAHGGDVGGTHLAWAKSYCPDYRNLQVTGPDLGVSSRTYWQAQGTEGRVKPPLNLVQLIVNPRPRVAVAGRRSAWRPQPLAGLAAIGPHRRPGSRPARLPARPRGTLHHVVDDQAGHVLAGGALDAFQARRTVDLQHQRAAAAAQQVEAGHAQAGHAGGADRRLPLDVGDLGRACGAAAVQVGAELATWRLPAHGRHHLAADHEAADVRALGLADEFLHQEVGV